MTNKRCTIHQLHCENCGSTDPSDLQGDDGYTDCCNECTATSDDCRGHHLEDKDN